MRKKSDVTDHCRQVPSRPRRRAGMSSGADAREFFLAHLVAFQHPILYSIPRGDGFHRDRNFNARAISSRKSPQAFYHRRPKMTNHGEIPWSDTATTGATPFLRTSPTTSESVPPK